MVPRLQEFRRSNAPVDLRMQQTDMEFELDQEGISLAVWRGDGNWRGYKSALLAAESISVLASPSWVQNNPPVISLDDLNSRSLIVLEEPHRYSPSSAHFYGAHGEVYNDDGGGLRLNDYTLVVQAGMAGEGPILGWDHITRHLVAAGLLVRIGDWHWESGAGFYLVWSEEADLAAEAETTRDWIASCGVVT
jgi:DNA-binding transcriptional LysR family regulator